MKKALLLFATLSFIFCFFSCEKDKSLSVIPRNKEGVFTGMNYELSELSPDQGVVIAGYKNQVPCLMRVNSDGFLLWEKEFPQIQGQLTGIAVTDQAIYISSNVDESIWTGYDSTYYCGHGLFYTYKIKYCEPQYEYSSTFDFVPNIEVNGTTYLNKISFDGDYELSKAFEGNTLLNANNNDVLSTYDNGDLALLCLDHYGYIPEELVMSPTYNRVDSVKYQTSKDQVNVFRLDANGHTIWTKSIDHIQAYFNLSEYKPVYNYNIHTSADYTAVVLDSRIVVYNNNGDSISTINQASHCLSSVRQPILLRDKFIYNQDWFHDWMFDSKTVRTNMEGIVLDESASQSYNYCQPLENGNVLSLNFIDQQYMVYTLDDHLKPIYKKALIHEKQFCNLLPVGNNAFYIIEEYFADFDNLGFGSKKYFQIRKEQFIEPY